MTQWAANHINGRRKQGGGKREEEERECCREEEKMKVEKEGDNTRWKRTRSGNKQD